MQKFPGIFDTTHSHGCKYAYGWKYAFSAQHDNAGSGRRSATRANRVGPAVSLSWQQPCGVCVNEVLGTGCMAALLVCKSFCGVLSVVGV